MGLVKATQRMVPFLVLHTHAHTHTAPKWPRCFAHRLFFFMLIIFITNFSTITLYCLKHFNWCFPLPSPTLTAWENPQKSVWGGRGQSSQPKWQHLRWTRRLPGQHQSTSLPSAEQPCLTLSHENLWGEGDSSVLPVTHSRQQPPAPHLNGKHDEHTYHRGRVNTLFDDGSQFWQKTMAARMGSLTQTLVSQQFLKRHQVEVLTRLRFQLH